jgi:hypothetical protein
MLVPKLKAISSMRLSLLDSIPLEGDSRAFMNAKPGKNRIKTIPYKKCRIENPLSLTNIKYDSAAKRKAKTTKYQDILKKESLYRGLFFSL